MRRPEPTPGQCFPSNSVCSALSAASKRVNAAFPRANGGEEPHAAPVGLFRRAIDATVRSVLLRKAEGFVRCIVCIKSFIIDFAHTRFWDCFATPTNNAPTSQTVPSSASCWLFGCAGSRTGPPARQW